MNKTKIEWTDYSWNPVTGCKHGCWYCYAKKLFTRFHKSFEPTFHLERLKDPWKLKKPSKIFCCSVADLFASWTLVEWRDMVLESMFKCPVKHVFQLLTKNPERIPKDIKFPDNVWVGTTVTSENNDVRNIEVIRQVNAKIRFVSFEPLLGEINAVHDNCLEGIDWVVIGKLTGSKRVRLDWNWVVDIIEECRIHKIRIFMKNNLGCEYPIQEFPT